VANPWLELAAPITSYHDWKHGVVDVGIALAMVGHRRMAPAFTLLAFICGRLISIKANRRLEKTALPARRFERI